MKLYVKWIVNPNSGYACEKLHINDIMVGSYYHTMLRTENKYEEYCVNFSLPNISIKKDKMYGTREEVKVVLLRAVRVWFEKVLKESVEIIVENE